MNILLLLFFYGIISFVCLDIIIHIFIYGIKNLTMYVKKIYSEKYKDFKDINKINEYKMECYLSILGILTCSLIGLLVLGSWLLILGIQ